MTKDIFTLLPNEAYLDVAIYQDGNPPRELAHNVFVASGAGQQQTDESKTKAPVFSERMLSRTVLGAGLTLAEFRAAFGGDNAHLSVAGKEFEVSIARWAIDDSDDIHVNMSIFVVPLFEEFTSEDWLAWEKHQADVDLIRIQQGLPTMDEVNAKRAMQGLPPLKVPSRP